jgi:hypothetical protein
MKLSKLFMIALLVGTLAAIGCGDSGSSNGGNGGSGNGGNGNGVCDFTAEELCEQCDAQDRVPACESAFDNCLANPPSGNFCEKCAFTAGSQCGAL